MGYGFNNRGFLTQTLVGFVVLGGFPRSHKFQKLLIADGNRRNCSSTQNGIFFLKH
jgi:hypothetical protein